MRHAIIALAASMIVPAAAGSAWAHHGWSDYDAGKRATLSGTVRELHFGNPHVTLVLVTPDRVWNVMLTSPARLKTRGVSEDMLKAGQEVTIEGLPHKTKPDEFRAERMTLGGTTIELR